MANTGYPTDDESLIDLRALVVRVWQRRLWVLTSVVVCTAAFAAVAFLMTPVYRASTILAPADENRAGDLSSALGALGGLASLSGGLGLSVTGAETEEAIAVLKSREFTERFIHEKNLMPKLFPSEWDSAQNRWRTAAGPTLARAFKYFDRRVRSVVQERGTGLVTLQIDWRDREEGAAWANELVQRLNEDMRQRAIVKADAAVGYLEKEANATSVVVARDAIGRLMEAQIKQRMIANVTPEYSFRVVGKALPADIDDPIKPQKVVLIVSGMLLGLALGIGGALITTRL